PEARSLSTTGSSSASNPSSLSVNLEPFLAQLPHNIHDNAASNNSNSYTVGAVDENPADAVNGAPAPNPTAGQQQNPNQAFIQVTKAVLPSLPFILLLALKFLYDHKVGLLLFVCLWLLFAKCNEGVTKLISRSRAPVVNLAASSGASHRRQAACLCLVCLATVLLVIYLFKEQSLWLSLICLPPNLQTYGFWSLLFTVTVADMLLKFVVMSIKLSAVCLLSDRLSCVSLTRIYLIVERFYQLYRQFVPIGVWYVTLVSGGGADSSRIYTSLLVIAYAIFKVHSLYTSAIPLVKILANLIQTPTLFGNNTAQSSTKSSDTGSCSDSNECPICRELMRGPVRLACQHAFCLDCLLRWLAQSRTCPMCRQAVAPPVDGQDALAWLDGSTTSGLQIY
ncbi:hypothetical protein BOX15_Mlig018433g1, partial [Macrostomum lignano]